MRNGEIVTKKVPSWLSVENGVFLVDLDKVNRQPSL